MADLNLTHVYYTKKTIETCASYNKVRDKCVPCFSFYIKVIKLLINTTKYQPRSLARYSITYPHTLSLSLSLSSCKIERWSLRGRFCCFLWLF